MPTITESFHAWLAGLDQRDAEMSAALDAQTATLARTQAELGQTKATLEQAKQALEQARAEFAAYVAAHPEQAPPTPPEDPKAALVAVRVFPSYATKVYGQHEAVLDLLGDLGVKRMSHKLTPALATDQAFLDFTRAAWVRYGIKSWLTMGEPHVDLSSADWDKMVAAMTGPLAGMVDLVSGWNEPNHIRGGGTVPTDWAARAVAHNRALWERFGGTGIKVGTPQLWSGNLTDHDADVRAVAKAGVAGTFDTITWHLYPRGGVGTALLDRFEATYRAEWSATAPIICTEAGYLDAPNYTGGASNLTPTEKATLLPQLVDSYLARGYGVSVFELLDDPDPSGANREAWLGQVACRTVDPATWTRKPSFHALKTYLTAP